MKKYKNWVIIFAVIFLIILILVLVGRKDTYKIKIEYIDNFSPDRELIVYKNNKKINFQELHYTDGTYLCSGANPTVSYSEIDGITELIIKIDEKKQFVAKLEGDGRKE